jgi:hypothetical protein
MKKITLNIVFQSESFLQILQAIFARKTPEVLQLTFDTDVAAKANSLHFMGREKGLSPYSDLLHAISEIRAGAVTHTSLGPLSMSSSSIMAATSALKRARNAGRLGKGGKAMLKRATQRTAGILAMRAACSTAITGTLDGVLGSDPVIVEAVCESLKVIFEKHGAVRLRSPLLRPRPQSCTETIFGGPAELVNSRGAILVLPEDLTAPFGMYACFLVWPC